MLHKRHTEDTVNIIYLLYKFFFSFGLAFHDHALILSRHRA